MGNYCAKCFTMIDGMNRGFIEEIPICSKCQIKILGKEAIDDLVQKERELIRTKKEKEKLQEEIDKINQSIYNDITKIIREDD